MTPEPDTFASRLQQLMDAKGFSQASLAKKSGIERTVINRMLKGTRHPNVFQIGVLAECLGVTPDDLMAGLRLLPQVQRAVDKERERTECILAAEAARDEAIGRADQLAVELERVQREGEREHEASRKTAASTEAAWGDRLRKAEAAHAVRQQTFDTTVRNLKGMLERAAAKVRADAATQVVLRNQITALQQRVARERSTKAGAGVLGGLFGIALGRSMD